MRIEFRRKDFVMCIEKKIGIVIDKKNYNQNKAMPLMNGKLQGVDGKNKRGYTLKTIDDDMPCVYCKQWDELK